MAVVVLDLEIEGYGAAGHSSPNSTHAKDSKRFSIRVMSIAHMAAPFAGA